MVTIRSPEERARQVRSARRSAEEARRSGPRRVHSAGVGVRERASVTRPYVLYDDVTETSRGRKIASHAWASSSGHGAGLAGVRALLQAFRALHVIDIRTVDRHS